MNYCASLVLTFTVALKPKMAAECPLRSEVTELHRRVNQVTDEVIPAGTQKLLQLLCAVISHYGEDLACLDI